MINDQPLSTTPYLNNWYKTGAKMKLGKLSENGVRRSQVDNLCGSLHQLSFCAGVHYNFSITAFRCESMAE